MRVVHPYGIRRGDMGISQLESGAARSGEEGRVPVRRLVDVTELQQLLFGSGQVVVTRDKSFAQWLKLSRWCKCSTLLNIFKLNPMLFGDLIHHPQVHQRQPG